MMKFSLVSPEGKLYEAEVDQVNAQGADGELGVLPDHIALVSPLKVAALNVKIKGEQHRLAVYGGMLQVTPESVTVLVEHADLPESIDRKAAQARQEELRGQLNRSKDAEERAKLERELDVVNVQLEVAE